MDLYLQATAVSAWQRVGKLEDAAPTHWGHIIDENTILDQSSALTYFVGQNGQLKQSADPN